MAINETGPLQFSDIRDEFVPGSAADDTVVISDYYRNGGIVPLGPDYANYSRQISGGNTYTIPTKGAISLGKFRGMGNFSPIWTASNSPVKTSYGSSVSRTVGIAGYIPGITVGTKFWVCVALHPTDTSWYYSSQSTITKLYTYGSNGGTTTTTNIQRKQHYLRLEYGGGSSFKFTNYYSGRSTDFPNGRSYLVGIFRSTN